MHRELFYNGEFYNRILIQKYFLDGYFTYYVPLTNGTILLFKSLGYDTYIKYLNTKNIKGNIVFLYLGLLMLDIPEQEILNLKIDNIPYEIYNLVSEIAYRITNFELNLNNLSEQGEDFTNFINNDNALISIYLTKKEKIVEKNLLQALFVNNRVSKEILLKRKEQYDLAMIVAKSLFGGKNSNLSQEYKELIDQITSGNFEYKSDEANTTNISKELAGKDLNTVDGLMQEVEQIKRGERDLHDEVIHAYEMFNLKNEQYKRNMDINEMHPKLKERLVGILEKVNKNKK